MHPKARLLGTAARGALRLYASDAAFSVGVRLALLLLVPLWLVALSFQCVPTTSLTTAKCHTHGRG